MTGTDDLDVVAGTRVFFGHQSVGADVLAGARAVYAAAERPFPPVADALIGSNGDPEGKIEDFGARLRSGSADRPDVAMMKLCYVDVTRRTDVSGLFESYRDALSRLERDLAGVSVVHVTVPLTTEPRLTARLRARATGRPAPGPADNLARERLNALLRAEYAGRLLDLAAVESTRPDGSRVTGTHEGATYHALHDGYASDEGHLNQVGARAAATAWIAAVARAVRAAGGVG